MKIFSEVGVSETTYGDNRDDSATHYSIFKVKMFSEEGVSETTCGDERDDPAASYFK